ncbi:hypothetical protein [Blastomonas sp.]|uniref:hypothetical protein n=1 Tax=Blastomonas sp. TaxID=1909299 RepID=UPI00391B54BF
MAGPESDKIGEILAKAFDDRSREPPQLLPTSAFQYAPLPEYEASLKPLEAIASYGYDRETAVVQLHRELQVARVVGIAEHAIWKRDSQVNQSYYLIVPTWFWASEVTLDQDFWQTGYRERFFPTAGYNIDTESWMRLFGVRFWFPSLAASTPQSDPESPATAIPSDTIGARTHDADAPEFEQKTLSNAELVRIAKGVAAGWGETLSEIGAWEYAKAHWPEHKIAKHRFLVQYRTFRGAKKPGKAVKNQ